MKKGKIVKSTAKNLPDGKVMRQTDDARYKYLGILKYEMIGENDSEWNI